MSSVQSFDSTERLPWLSDPVRPQPRQPKRSWFPLAIAASTAAAIAFGGLSVMQPGQPEPVAVPAPEPLPTATVGPERTAADGHVPPAAAPAEPLPQVRPAPVPQVKIAEPRQEVRHERPRRAAPAEQLTQSERPAAARDIAAAPVRSPVPVVRPAVRPQPLALWPAGQVAGAYGRLVQIGAFGTRQQAKVGWRKMQRAYPAVGRLPAVVVEARNSRGRKFYRFQIGTTSQAHSEVLCQRMRSISFSCAVLGLPWKAKVER